MSARYPLGSYAAQEPPLDPPDSERPLTTPERIARFRAHYDPDPSDDLDDGRRP